MRPLTLGLVALSLAGTVADAQQRLTAGVVWIPAAVDTVSRVEERNPAAADSAKPLIHAPSWWPKRVTHQNVAALLVVGTVSLGAIWILPEDISKWDKSVPMRVYLKRAYTRAPVWDDDHLYWNYVIHPVTGSWVYLMERNHGRSPIRGFLLSTAASIGWEYGFEAVIEQPSIQDLLITSPVGSLLGELSYRATLGMKRDGFNGLERVVLTIINPAYVVTKGYR